MSDGTLVDKSVQVNLEKHHTVNEGQSCDVNLQHKNDKSRIIITKEEAVYLSKVSISPDAELLDYNLKEYSEEKIGFFGSHQKLTIEVKLPGCNANVKKNFFVKTMPFDVPLQAAYTLEKNAFGKEVEFLQKIEPIMTANFKGESWTPKCYLAKENTLVLEDMKDKGFSNKPRMLNEENLMSAVACLARFHATSLLAEERLDGKPLNEVFPNAFEESEYKDTERRHLWYNTAINYAISLAKDLGLETSHVLESSKRVFDIAIPSTDKRNVVTHGDLWSNNLLFDEASHCRLIDFQTLRYAPPGQDLMQFLYMCCTRKFRQEREMDILNHYYKHFKVTLESNVFTGVIPTFKEIKRGVDQQKFPALISAVINFPTVMIDGKIGAEIINDSETFDNYFFHDRKPVVDKAMSMDAEYETRVKDIVRELVELSFQADDYPRVS